MPTETVTRGETFSRALYPKVEGAPVSIASDAVVTLSVQDCNEESPEVFVNPITIDNNDPRHDYANGKVWADLTAAQTLAVAAGRQTVRLTITEAGQVGKYSETVRFVS